MAISFGACDFCPEGRRTKTFKNALEHEQLLESKKSEMMKNGYFNLLVFSILLVVNISFSQTPYFQQKVDYKIQVRLDDRRHTLTGKIKMIYTNNSPHTLDKIYFHLWPNAYSNKKTAFAKQQIHLGKTEFYFAREEDLGYIRGLEFQVDGTDARFRLMAPDTPDIGILQLPAPLLPGKHVEISTPFEVKLPKTFSRSGHSGDAYQVTQWYPKPAVFDRKGWHPMPYLDQGEFYSEWGSFDVTITLPADYVVGATGDLQTQSEIEFLRKRVADTKAFLKEGRPIPQVLTDTEKTLRYVADSVHDFAWFASKHFLVSHDSVFLSSGRKVETWALYPPENADGWQHATKYIGQAIQFYSGQIGEYPYRNMTAVNSIIEAGGGMEYPMITVIDSYGGEDLDIVIAHETGHNWFYGMLASNERDNAWMDEGINTFYEKRYRKKYYPESAYLNDLLLTAMLRSQKDCPVVRSPAQMTEIQYGAMVYLKPAIGLRTLEAMAGTEAFDRTMKDYFEQWKFKHPEPEDFQKIWEAHNGPNAGWFFGDYLHTVKYTDYSIGRRHYFDDKLRIKIKNRGGLASPVFFQTLANNEVVEESVLPGTTDTLTLNLPFPANIEKWDRIAIDANGISPELKPYDNYFPREFGIRLFPMLEERSKKQCFLAPVLFAGNGVDGYMPGILASNSGLLPKKHSFFGFLGFGLKTRSLVGMYEYKHPIRLEHGLLERIELHHSGRFFSYISSISTRKEERYFYMNTGADFVFRNKNPLPERRHWISLQVSPVWEFFHEDSVVTGTGPFRLPDARLNQRYTIGYHIKKENGLARQRLDGEVELGEYSSVFTDKKSYSKVTVTYRLSRHYNPKHSIHFGLFAGYFLKNVGRYSSNYNDIFTKGSFAASSTASQDYGYRHIFLDRRPSRPDSLSFFSRQIYKDGAGMKLPELNAPVGKSNDRMFAANFAIDLPLPMRHIFVRPYFDYVIYNARESQYSLARKSIYSGGIQVDFFEAVQINFPVLNSKEIRLYLPSKNRFLNSITFSVNLDKLKPDLISKMLFGL